MARIEDIVQFIDKSPQRSIFSYPWWLEATADTHFRYLVVEQSGEIRAVMPIVETKRFGLKMCTMPPYTQSLGCLLPPLQGKYSTRLAAEHELLGMLIKRLPEYHHINLRLHPSQDNWLPFYWSGFSQWTRYTYVLDDISDLDFVWEGMRSSARGRVRKARKQVHLSHDSDIERLIHLQTLTYQRQGMQGAHRPDVIKALFEACSTRDQGKLFFAEDETGRIHSGLLLVWDDQTAHYLIGGSDPSLWTSGAFSFLMWEAIRFAGERVKSFNFEGSMVQSIERFFRGFGARQVPYFQITKSTNIWIKMARTLLAREKR